MERLQAEFKKRIYLPSIFGALFLLIAGLSGIGISLVRVYKHTGRLNLIPYFSIDDLIYNAMMHSDRLCLQNVSSILDEGGCRVEALWRFAHYLQIGGNLVIGAILLRVILIICLVIALYVTGRSIAQLWGTPAHKILWWYYPLVILGPLPLMLFNFSLSIQDATILISAINWPTNLFSMVMYVVVCGGFYAHHKSLKLWPLFGVLGGIWTFTHPYNIYFWLALSIIWALLDIDAIRHSWLNKLCAISLIAPTIISGAYYIYLWRTNKFFGYLLANNITIHSLPIRLSLLAGFLISFLIIFAVLKRDGIYLRQSMRIIDPHLIVWLIVSAGLQFVPSKVSTRFILVLFLPIGLVIMRILTSIKSPALKNYMIIVLLMNFVILTAISINLGIINSRQSLRPAEMSEQDIRAGEYLRTSPAKYFIATPAGTKRFTWYSHATIVNHTQMESPDWLVWQKNMRAFASNAMPCSDMERELLRRTIGAVITDKFEWPVVESRFRACKFKINYENPSWTIFTPEIMLEK